MISAKACSKVILFGEHAVVYNQPAIAIPVKKFYTRVFIKKSSTFKWITDQKITLQEEKLLLNLFDLLFTKTTLPKNISIFIKSNIPRASGLGSSASLSVALIRGLFKFFDVEISIEKLNELAYEAEKIFHITPSGIDNTTISYEKPIFFIKGKEPNFIEIKKSLSFIIANSGIKSYTKEVVNLVREKYIKEQLLLEEIFKEIGNIVKEALFSLEKGDNYLLGSLMNKNHTLLKKLGVSSPKLDRLVNIAIMNNALGAKVIGAGKGGNIIVLTKKKNSLSIKQELKKEGVILDSFTIGKYQ